MAGDPSEEIELLLQFNELLGSINMLYEHFVTRTATVIWCMEPSIVQNAVVLSPNPKSIKLKMGNSIG